MMTNDSLITAPIISITRKVVIDESEFKPLSLIKNRYSSKKVNSLYFGEINANSFNTPIAAPAPIDKKKFNKFLTTWYEC